ncbi:N-acetylmuramoyl-L-alanine amidase [Sutcliffiella cohnii]
MTLIVLDPGHGGTDPGAVNNNYQEKNFTLTISKKVSSILKANYNATVLMTRDSDQTLSLQARTNFANTNNAGYFCSIHVNAGGGTGFESFRYNGPILPQTKALHESMHRYIVESLSTKYNIRDRGVKTANFHVLRETKMPAVLLEILFIDNEADLRLLRNETFINDVAKAIANALANSLNLQKKTTNQLFRVIAGSFSQRKNAEDRVNLLKEKGKNAIITAITRNGNTLYRVQAGAFHQRANAEKLINELKLLGIDSFIYSGNITTPSQPSKPQPTPNTNDYSIIGESHVDPTYLDQFVKKVNKNAPSLGALYVDIGNKYGIRGDVAFAQAIHETNYFRFTGVVKADQNNFAGIGATGGGVTGASFKTEREGVLAHIQHLFAYASKDKVPPNGKIVDPRFNYVTRGSATQWVDLNGKWAVPGTNYGQQILSIYKRILEEEVLTEWVKLEKKKEILKNELKDY